MNGIELLDPELRPLVAAVPMFALSVDVLPALRGGGLFGPPPELSDAVERTEYVVSADPEVIVRVHRPKGVTGPMPCVYSIHGGGYVMGSRDMDDVKFDRWCPMFSCVGVAVEYRLAPETPYPGPLEDCYLGLAWVRAHAAELGVDPDRIGITGTSAGGGLAAALGLLARDRAEIPLQFQLLDCPMLDDRRVTTSSRTEQLVIWSRESNEFGWRSYLGDRYGTDDVPYHAAPARCEDLSGLPPTFVCVGGADGFRDEDIDYALRLGQAGVPTDLHVYAGAPHGVQLFAGTDVAGRYGREAEAWIGRKLRS